jgi:hypothetical protein
MQVFSNSCEEALKIKRVFRASLFIMKKRAMVNLYESRLATAIHEKRGAQATCVAEAPGMKSRFRSN